MPIPDAQRACAEALLTDLSERRVPLSIRDRVRLNYRVRGMVITLFERRFLPFGEAKWVESPVARFRYDEKGGRWRLLWRDRRQRFHTYDLTRPAIDIADLIAEVERDPTGIFWG